MLYLNAPSFLPPSSCLPSRSSDSSIIQIGQVLKELSITQTLLTVLEYFMSYEVAHVKDNCEPLFFHFTNLFYSNPSPPLPTL